VTADLARLRAIADAQHQAGFPATAADILDAAEEIERLRRALWDAVHAPMGVVPDSAAEFWAALTDDEARQPQPPSP
jgi:hypothetical protein